MTTVSSDGTGVTTDRRYTSVAIILHWVIAVAVLAQIVGGKWMVSADATATGSVFTIFQLHKTIGLTILGLTLARIIWRLAHPAPGLPDGMSRLEVLAASGTHIGFYGFLILVPLSGWAMASVSPTGVPTFFLLMESLPFGHLPLLGEAGLPERHAAEAFLKTVHEIMSLAMGLLVALHVAAALKHQLIARDNLIARMILSARTLPQSASKAGVGALAAFATLAFLGGGIAWGIAQKPGGIGPESAPLATAQSGQWAIDHDQSSLSFTITFTGNTVIGEVANWSADIQFDPDDLDNASALITIDMASVTLANPTLQAQARTGDGFDLANHATATYQAGTFTRTDDGAFLADGALTLRGTSVDVPVRFTFEESDDTANVEGNAELSRLDFGIGAVGAADEAWLLYGVDVSFDLVANRAELDTVSR
jgi:cytochrome b561